jgi:AraC-like DNA-binding protein
MPPIDGAVYIVEKKLQEFGVQVLLSHKVRVTPHGWRLDLLSPFWRLYRMQEAGASIVWQGEEIALEVGRIYVIPAWVGFSTRTRKPALHEYVHFTVTGLQPSWIRRTFDFPIKLPENDLLRAIGDTAFALLDATPRDLFGSFGWAGSLAQAAMVMAVEHLPAPKKEQFLHWLTSPQDVQAAMDLIDTQTNPPPTNAELAAACRLSPDHFIRVFKEGTGLTPAQYRLERRVLAAAHLLLDYRRKIDEIAESTGFTDRFYFTRMFKARLGLTPAAYRRMHQMEHSRGE